MNAEQLLVSLFAAATGGFGIKALELLLPSRSQRIDIATQLRTELRAEIKDQRSRIDALEAEASYWRNQHFSLWLIVSQADSLESLQRAIGTQPPSYPPRN